jgi:RNA polymerase subunit RPABC4/transcription elongation factor Spt4
MDPMEAYVQQLIAQGYPEETARAHAAQYAGHFQQQAITDILDTQQKEMERILGKLGIRKEKKREMKIQKRMTERLLEPQTASITPIAKAPPIPTLLEPQTASITPIAKVMAPLVPLEEREEEEEEEEEENALAECGACKATIPVDSENCPECGVSFSGISEEDFGECGACGTLNPLDSKQCNQCGVKFVTDELLLSTDGTDKTHEKNDDEDEDIDVGSRIGVEVDGEDIYGNILEIDDINGTVIIEHLINGQRIEASQDSMFIGEESEIKKWLKIHTDNDEEREPESYELPPLPLLEIPEMTQDEELHSRFNRTGKAIQGGMADVYEATERATGKTAIWKQAAPDRLNPLSNVNKALKNESEILQSLSHPRIPKHIAFGQVEDDERHHVNVLVMEKIEGDDLASSMRMQKARGQTEEFSIAKKTILEVCEALEYMADQDPPVYHRDIKPHNVILNPSKGAVLIDFGLAKGVEAGAGYSHTGGAGTEGYKPPERDDGNTGAFTDVYSLSQFLWVLVTGERPFKMLTPEELREILAAKGNPTWLAELLHVSCARWDRRIQTATEFRLRLENKGELP